MADINLGMALLALFVFGLLIRLIEAVASYLPIIIGVGVVVFVAWKIFSIYRAAGLEAASERRAVIHQRIAKELFTDLSIEVFEFAARTFELLSVSDRFVCKVFCLLGCTDLSLFLQRNPKGTPFRSQHFFHSRAHRVDTGA